MSEWVNELFPNKKAAYNLKTRYGITPADFVKLIENQDGRCAICACRFHSQEKPFVDHCHTGGHVRGLLCNACNLGLGKFGDSKQILEKATDYLNEDSKLNKTPTQAQQVLDYLAKRKHITQATATSVLGISRLAAVVHRINKKTPGRISRRMVEGVRASFAEYSLAS